MTAKSSQQQDTAQAVTQPATHEQLLALLGELNDKLLPLPAPKPETVSSVDMNYILPLDGLRQSLQKSISEINGIMREASVQLSALYRKMPAARNERAWGVVFLNQKRSFQTMTDAAACSLQAVDTYLVDIARMLVLAADGDPETVNALLEGEGHE